MKIKDVVSFIEEQAPLSLQEPYDNAGLIIGDDNKNIDAVLLSIDVTEEVVDEAVKKDIPLIIAHHPIIFEGLKKITGKNYVERTVLKAIKNDIAIYAAHTNIDAVNTGVNKKICDKVGLINTKTLVNQKNGLVKLVTFAPKAHATDVRNAIFESGAGTIGDYDSCSFNIDGNGTFRGNENTNPFVGNKGKIHTEPETRIEVILPRRLLNRSIPAMIKAHPYEEVAYDVYPLSNENPQAGMGMIGELPEAVDEIKFLTNLKDTFHARCIRHTKPLNKPIKKVAVCGGSGSFLLKDAIDRKADVFISGDFKYHQFFDADNKILIADIGHFESEQFTLEIFYEILKKNLTKFAIHFSEVNTNPINYL